MLMDAFKGCLKKYFYVLREDRFENHTSQTIFTVINLKHPLLKPELIVINDELLGFKGIPKHAQSLDRFDIVCEVESFKEDSVISQDYVDSINLYCEIELPTTINVDDIIKMATIYGKTTEMEYVRRINSGEPDLCIIYSKLNTMFFNHVDDIEERYEDLLFESDLDVIIELHFKGFINFIRRLDRLFNTSKLTVKPFLT